MDGRFRIQRFERSDRAGARGRQHVARRSLARIPTRVGPGSDDDYDDHNHRLNEHTDITLIVHVQVK